MSIQDNQKFDVICKECGNNVFEAVKLISSCADYISKSTFHKVDESDAIEWIMNREYPKFEDLLSYPQSKQHLIDTYISTYTELVDDTQVKASVKLSIYSSYRSRKLKFIYAFVSDEYRRSRVRILTRMIWYALYPVPKRTQGGIDDGT